MITSTRTWAVIAELCQPQQVGELELTGGRDSTVYSYCTWAVIAELCEPQQVGELELTGGRGERGQHQEHEDQRTEAAAALQS